MDMTRMVLLKGPQQGFHFLRTRIRLFLMRTRIQLLFKADLDPDPASKHV